MKGCIHIHNYAYLSLQLPILMLFVMEWEAGRRMETWGGEMALLLLMLD